MGDGHQRSRSLRGGLSPAWGTPDDVSGYASRNLRTVPATTRCASVDRLFRTDPALPCVAVRDGDRIGLVMRDRFEHAMTGPFGYGRALWHHRPVRALADWAPLMVPARLPLLRVVQRLRERSAGCRYDDLLVEFDDGRLGRVPAAAILDALAVRLEQQASHDGLTGVANRAHLLQQLTAACVEANAGGPRLLVVFVDLDGMKRVNDTYGHRVGDTLLVGVAGHLAEAAGADAVVGRLGGDEFAVLYRVPATVDALAHGRSIGERLRAAVARPDPTLPTGVQGRASVGVAISGGHTDAVSLLAEADAAMYRAKQAGGDAVAVITDDVTPPWPDPDPGAGVAGRTVLEAIADRQLRVVYQPIVRVGDGRLVAVEALLRWQHPRLGLLTPDRFLPGAERAGHLPALDQWVLVTACADLAAWIARLGDHAPARVNINCSMATLAEPDFDRRVLDALAHAGLTSDRIRIELPEHASLAALGAAQAQLDRLRGYGVAIALDDMGAGASTLRHLSMVAVTELKIDRSFVAGMLTNDRDHAVVRLLADLGQSLGLGVTAEGVEHAGQLAALAQLGIGYAQGYHTGRPQQADQIATMLSLDRFVSRQR